MPSTRDLYTPDPSNKALVGLLLPGLGHLISGRLLDGLHLLRLACRTSEALA